VPPILNQALAAGGVPFAGALALRNTLWVDPVTGDDATAGVGTGRPFRTLQAAINAVPRGSTSASARNVFTVLISPADYDEDLTIDLGQRRIVLASWGPWGLGVFNAADWAPSTARSITVTWNGATHPVVDGIRPGLVIAPLALPGEGQTTHQAYLTRPRISGLFDFTGAAVSSIEVTLCCEVFGVAGVALNAGLATLQLYLWSSRLRGSASGTNVQLQVARDSRFDALVSVGAYSLLENCRFAAGFTTVAAPPATLTPQGFVNCDVAGTFTAPATGFRTDANTQHYFETNAGTLAGGATKALQYSGPQAASTVSTGSATTTGSGFSAIGTVPTIALPANTRWVCRFNGYGFVSAAGRHAVFGLGISTGDAGTNGGERFVGAVSPSSGGFACEALIDTGGAARTLSAYFRRDAGGAPPTATFQAGTLSAVRVEP
jgi:hypothetical protein